MSASLDISTVRLLAVDMVSKANSGHPGAPLGMAPAAHVVFSDMKFNPQDADWPNRDRFVLSNGHAVALLYAMLHLTGYPLSLDDLKQFRQLGSKTPGHPEFHTPGVEVTTGPLGQGIANAVGLAIAQANVAATYNKPGFDISSNFTYCFFGDGCMMEGISHEACSLAGHLQLGRLVCFYDDNKVSIDGNTAQEFTEDVGARLESYGWQVLNVDDADTDVEAIAAALKEAKACTDKPTCIKIHTTIGYGSLHQGTAGVHGSPLKPDDVAQMKRKFGFDPEKSFYVPDSVYDYYHGVAKTGANAEAAWKKLFASYKAKYPELAAEYARRQAGEMPAGWEKALPAYKSSDPATATRKLSEVALSSLAPALPELIGGSADLTPSNKTRWASAVDFQPPSLHLGNSSYAGRYIRYGVREHAMGAIMNGLSAYGLNFRPYAGTFLNFVSYAAGSVRISALSGHPVIWVATHDSIGLGEDGPTHQPIETLAHFRAMPNLMVWRPADGNEVSAAYKVSLESKHTPAIVALTRQGVPELAGSSVEAASKGGYVVKNVEKPKLIIVATGSEVALSIEASKILDSEGIATRVVSLPDFCTFGRQSHEYKKEVLPGGIPVLSVEALATFGWGKYSHAHFGLDRFGASGKGPEIFKAFGFTKENVAEKGRKVVAFYKDVKVISPVDGPFN